MYTNFMDKSSTTRKKSSTNPKARSKVTRKAPPKKRTNAQRSFKVSKPITPFFTFQLTKQTLYWLVIGGVVLLFGIWLLELQSDIQSIYDSIDAVNADAGNI